MRGEDSWRLSGNKALRGKGTREFPIRRSILVDVNASVTTLELFVDSPNSHHQIHPLNLAPRTVWLQQPRQSIVC